MLMVMYACSAPFMVTVLLDQKKCHAGKHDQDSMEEQAPFKKARTGNAHVEVCKHSATCIETSCCFDGRMHPLTI